MTKKYILIILALSLLTRFAFFGHPAETVFDEVHFGKFVSGYFTGEYFFDIHPPLGKLLIAGVAKISGFNPGFSFETIGQKYLDDSYKWLRFLPKLAGALLPVIVFLIAIELGLSQKMSFLAGMLTVFENSLLTQSRFILLDSFLLLFGFLSILFFLKSGTINFKRSPVINISKKYLFLSGLFSSLAFSIKWTGLSFLTIILIFYILETSKYNTYVSRLEFLLKGLFTLFILVIIPLLIYFSIFAIHFSLLDKPGPGLAFHSPNFQQKNIFSKFIELNAKIYQSNARLTASHPYSSDWFTWPFMTRSVYYWNGSTSSFDPELRTEGLTTNSISRIYFLGNPIIWWLSTAAVIYLMFIFLKSVISKKFYFLNSTFYFLIIGFWLNLLPFIFIGRVMFLYHYMTSLIFAILILCFQLDKLKNKVAFNAILAGSIILFLFFSPLTYGFAIPEWYYKLMVWLPSWR